MTNFQLVAEFMEACDQEIQIYSGLPNKDTLDLRISLIQEELEELEDAVAEKDIVEVADALTDLLYVIYGMGHSCGINLDACFEEVHESNMSKLGEDGQAIKDAFGKVMKGPRYFAPSLLGILDI